MEENLLDSPERRLSDTELARRLRVMEASGFLKLANLLRNDLRAVRAMREESKFTLAHPELPRGPELAGKIRGWLIENKLEWSQENLQKAVDAMATVSLEARS